MPRVTSAAEVVMEEAEMQSVVTYIGHRRGAVVQWVALCPIFEVYSREQGYKGGALEDTIVDTRDPRRNTQSNLG